MLTGIGRGDVGVWVAVVWSDAGRSDTDGELVSREEGVVHGEV